MPMSGMSYDSNIRKDLWNLLVVFSPIIFANVPVLKAQAQNTLEFAEEVKLDT
jgi:hypothetical protein